MPCPAGTFRESEHMTVNTGDALRRQFAAADPSGFPTELRLILSCLHLSPNERDSAQIRQLSTELIDWDRFLLSVDRHKVAPLVYTNLRRFAWRSLPQSVRDKLSESYRSNTLRNMAIAAETARLTKLLETNGIPVLVLKGPALALLVYGNLSLRSAGDIDLLIAERKMDRAERLICEEGYRRTKDRFPLPDLKMLVKQLIHHRRYSRAVQGMTLELHWRLNRFQSLFDVDFDRIRERAQEVYIGSLPVHALATIDLLPYLLMHGANHGWKNLFWLCDVAQILSMNPGLDWPHLPGLANELGILRHIAQGVILSHFLLGSQLPDQVRAYAERDRVMSRLVSHAVRSILSASPKPASLRTRIREKQYILSLNKEIRYKVEVVGQTLIWKGSLFALRHGLLASAEH